MTSLSDQQIRDLLAEYGAGELPDAAVDQIQVYLQVFELWGRRVNLTTIREPAQVVRRHFGEGLALASALPRARNLLDLGSGAGFPGIPITLAHPEMNTTLAESQSKKAAFLREVTDRMNLKVSVWSARAEDMVGARSFNIVTLRAVDDMRAALASGVQLLAPRGLLAWFVGSQQEVYPPAAKWERVERIAIPGCDGGAVLARLA